MSRYLLLIAALAFLAFMVLFTVTDLAWQWGGRQPETYPEIFYAAIGTPSALGAVLISLIIVKYGYQTLDWHTLRWRVFIVGAALWTFSTVLTGVAMILPGWFNPFDTTFFGLLISLVLIGIGLYMGRAR